jgi:hypothetical protein
MRTRWRFGETRCALFSPRRSKRFVVVQSDKRENFEDFDEARARVETEKSDEKNKRVDKERVVALLGSSFSSVLPSSFFFSCKEVF